MPYKDPEKRKQYAHDYWAKRGSTNLYFTFGTDREMHSRLKARAEKNKVTMVELMRTYVEWGLENEHA